MLSQQCLEKPASHLPCHPNHHAFQVGHSALKNATLAPDINACESKKTFPRQFEPVFVPEQVVLRDAGPSLSRLRVPQIAPRATVVPTIDLERKMTAFSAGATLVSRMLATACSERWRVCNELRSCGRRLCERRTTISSSEG